MSTVTSIEQIRREAAARSLEIEANNLMCATMEKDENYFLTARLAKLFKDRAQKYRDGLLPLTLMCPGCGIQLLKELEGGYHCFCRFCVQKFPPAPDANGFILVGTYPNFEWKPVTKSAVAYIQNNGKVAL